MSISTSIAENLARIDILASKIKTLTDNKITEYKCYADRLVIAVVDRSLKLSRGFVSLIKEKNSQCAATITRCQIDNLARFYGINLVTGREREYVYTFLDPTKKFDKLKDNQKNRLSDWYLVDMLDKNHQGIKRIYDEFCSYTHLSEKHHRTCSQLTQKTQQDGKNYIEFTSCISEYDQHLDDVSYHNISKEFLNINNILLEELNNYFSNRKAFRNNDLI